MADSGQPELAGERPVSPRLRRASLSGDDDSAGAAAGLTEHFESSNIAGGSAKADGASNEADVLAEAFTSLFTSFAEVVQGELQCSNSEYELLKEMNLKTAAEYDNFSDFASGLRVFVDTMKDKNETLSQLLTDIEGIDRSVTELEVLVSTLDNYTNTLYAQMMAAFANN